MGKNFPYLVTLASVHSTRKKILKQMNFALHTLVVDVKNLRRNIYPTTF
jgi:predicted house-cleaning NTP pyrophosphatase (Maf/HAM1 superfamily)